MEASKGGSKFSLFVPFRSPSLKVGVHLKAVFMPLKIGQIEIPCLHFKQYKNPPFITANQ